MTNGCISGNRPGEISAISQVLRPRIIFLSIYRRVIISHFRFLFIEEVEFEDLVGDERKHSSIRIRRLDIVN